MLLAYISPRDRINRTVRDGDYLRYSITEVLDQWSVWKHAYRVTLEDGTELVTSGDHRFLTDRGWKHVSDNAKCPQRAHLTTNNKLMGVGAFAEPPIRSAPYRDGYLCGLIRGDGHIGTYRYRRPNRSRDEHHRFRLALTDFEALRRAREYLRGWGVETQQFTFAEATATTRRAVAIRTSPAGAVATVRQATRWPDRPGPDWCKGFLAAIFHAEGSSDGSIRLTNTDPELIDTIT